MIKYNSLSETIKLVKSTLGQMTEAEEALLPQWCWECMPFLGIADDEVEVCVLKPKNLMAPKPENFRILIDLSLHSEDVTKSEPTAYNTLPHVFRAGKKRVNQLIEYPKELDANGAVADLIDVSEDRKHIILGSNGTGVQSIVVRYFSYPLDEQGQPMIRQDDKMAIVAFCQFMWAMRQGTNQSAITNFYNMWRQQADHAVGRSKTIHHEQAKTLMRRWVSLIPIFNPNTY